LKARVKSKSVNIFPMFLLIKVLLCICMLYDNLLYSILRNNFYTSCVFDNLFNTERYYNDENNDDDNDDDDNDDDDDDNIDD